MTVVLQCTSCYATSAASC